MTTKQEWRDTFALMLAVWAVMEFVAGAGWFNDERKLR